MNILPFIIVSLLFVLPPLIGGIIFIFITKKLIQEIDKVKNMNEQELLKYNERIRNENLRFNKLASRRFIFGFPVFVFILDVIFAFTFYDFNLKHFISGFFISLFPPYLFGILFFSSLEKTSSR